MNKMFSLHLTDIIILKIKQRISTGPTRNAVTLLLNKTIVKTRFLKHMIF